MGFDFGWDSRISNVEINELLVKEYKRHVEREKNFDQKSVNKRGVWLDPNWGSRIWNVERNELLVAEHKR